MKKFKRFTIILLTLTLVFTFSGLNPTLAKGKPHSNRFMDLLEFHDTDIPNWAEQYIAKMQVKNVFKGYNDGTFRPNQPVSRAEAIITAVRLMGLEEEAKTKDLSIPLQFKDSKQLDGKYLWAKGYVMVALENGLFETSLDKIQPNKAASRVWVATLLVKALGLEEEALRHMSVNLDFTDAKDIPAGAIGYVNVAADRGIVTGYGDGKFLPNKPVTRAEMAALLARTSDELQEENGVISVTGKVKNLNFDTTTESDEVNGTISVETFNGNTYTFAIPSDLLVQYHNRFITAEQLIEGDYVSLDVEDGVVVEAAYLDNETIENNIRNINEFKLELKYGEDNKYKLSYKNSDGEIRAEVEYKNDEQDQKITGQEAVQQVKDFVDELNLSPDMTRDQIKDRILDTLQITEFEELEIQITFSNGMRIHIELENDDVEEVATNEYNIDDFKLKVEAENAKYEWKYQYEDGEVRAEINHESAFRNLRIKGDEAKVVIEGIFEDIELDDEMTKEQMMEKIYNRLQLAEKNAVKAEFEIKFSSGIEVKFEKEFDGEEESDDTVNTESNINNLDLNLETESATYQWGYHFEDGAITAVIENEMETRTETIRGEEAKGLIEDLELDDEMTNDEIIQKIYNQLEITEENVVKMELEITFTNGMEVSIVHDFGGEED